MAETLFELEAKPDRFDVPAGYQGRAGRPGRRRCRVRMADPVVPDPGLPLPGRGHGPCCDCQDDATTWLDVALPAVVLVLALIAFALAWWWRP